MASQDTASLESKKHESDRVSDAKEAPESKTRGAWGDASGWSMFVFLSSEDGPYFN